MAEVVDLLSSSPPQAPITAKQSETKSKTFEFRSGLVDFDFDDFDGTGDLSFRLEQPAKRRKLSPISAKCSKTATSSTSTAPFDLSSEPDLPDLPRLTKSGKCTKLTHANPAAGIDDLVFTSSAPELRRQKKPSELVDAVFDLSSDSLPDDPFQVLSDRIIVSSQPTALAKNKAGFSLNTENILAELATSYQLRTTSRVDALVSQPSKRQKKGANELSRSVLVVDDIVVSSPARNKGKRPQRPPNNEDVAAYDVSTRKTVDTNKKAEKDAQKETEKERKRQEKDEKTRERQVAADKAEVNKSKINKSDTTPEMIIELSASLQDTSVGSQVLEFMKNLNVDTHFVEEEVNLTSKDDQYHSVGSIVRWKRKISSEYDKANDEWIPTTGQRLQDEQHFLIYLTATEFVKLVAGHATGSDKVTTITEEIMRQNVDLFVAKFRSVHGTCTPILLIQGLDAWLKKNTSSKNREYTAAVRAQAAVEEDESNPQAPSSSRSGTRKRKKAVEPILDLSFVTSDVVDELMLHLQLNHQPVVVQRTTSPTTSATEIVKFTQHLSTRPGRIAFQELNLKSASFCMESGQIKTGDDARDTYVKMLQEVQRVTPSMAYGIITEYDSVLKLVKGFKQSNNLMLEEVRKSTNKDGGWSDKRLGPMVSKRLYKIFTGRDPAATDGMS